MTIRVCEQMVHRPSSQSGWSQWGEVDPQGNFVPLWGVESKHDQFASMYFLDAAGICDIQGKSQMGQPAPVDAAATAPVAGGDAPIPSVSGGATAIVVSEAESQSVLSQITSDQVMGGVGLAVVALLALAYWQHRRTQATDTTEAPSYSENPYGGQD